MKKIITTGIVATIIAASMFAQTSYACFCIKGIIWEKGCDSLFPQKPKPTPQKPVETPVETPTPTPSTPTTPVQTETPVTPTPVVKVASVTTTTTTPAPVQLPETGMGDSVIAIAGLGALAYAGAYGANRFMKR